MSGPADVLARKVFEEYSRAGGNPPDAHFDRNAAEQWMAHALEFAGVAELIEKVDELLSSHGEYRGYGGAGEAIEEHMRAELVSALARVRGAA
ncbi:hypothetical protein [Stenotrophomonas tumulicola]|uniref:Uncharacterized protein n=1 Tax=Stenotrophomonas tumulicola TaxID=1685415 RepID=A0A7W3FJ82_9GAMM|nr:hypothetical protein [Stenotrophomonas tumulicola]MBA8680485.1 hypothetical protein [Stenotrophomonas tumulicola]